MKVYPKVPRHDHPVVPDGFYDRDDLVLLEKYDGSSFRFTLFDSHYEDCYPEGVVDAADGDGSLVFGTRKTIRGHHQLPLEDIDGALHRAVRCLRSGVDAEALRTVHDRFDEPVTVYAENMVYTTVDYGYTEESISALIGFDILPYSEVDTYTPKGNPYEETFESFLDVDTAWDIFDQLTVQDAPHEHTFRPAAVLPEPKGGFDPDSYTFPPSTIAENVRVEGVVVRSDETGRRAKLVRDEFKERRQDHFGKQPSNVNTGAEYIVAKYCTPGRIRKQVREMIIEDEREFGLHLNEDLHRRVVADIWAENWQEIMKLDRSITPRDVYPLVAKRCITELRKMKTNSELNDVDPTTLWTHLG